MFGGDPDAALIQYTSNEEARAAISSIEAVLNNRFIRVYWHREPTGGQQEQGQGGSGSSSGQGPSVATQHTTTHKVSLSRVGLTDTQLCGYHGQCVLASFSTQVLEAEEYIGGNVQKVKLIYLYTTFNTERLSQSIP